ncbi:MAG: hypothetical protein M5U09_25735 [Gammaproteobacteria bacterium]|nr:hypothetical protein [Gammaproteobacteria bacterium]
MPTALAALQLDAVDDQALEDLWRQRAFRRHLGALRLEAPHDALGFLGELALQHHAVIDHGRDAVDQLAPRGKLPVLGVSHDTWQQRQGQNGDAG